MSVRGRVSGQGDGTGVRWCGAVSAGAVGALEPARLCRSARNDVLQRLASLSPSAAGLGPSHAQCRAVGGICVATVLLVTAHLCGPPGPTTALHRVRPVSCQCPA